MIRTGTHHVRTHRKGVTLLEVLLASSILAMALAALSQLTSIGINAGIRTQLEAEAMGNCRNLMDELLVAGGEIQPITSSQIDNSPGWIWSLDVVPVDDYLNRLTVTVENLETSPPVQGTLTQLVRRPVEGHPRRSP